VVSNILIVESENDKYFIEAFLKHMNLNLEVGEPICSISDYECLCGIDKLEQKLKFVRVKTQKKSIDKVGIIFDADSIGVETRKSEIEEKIELIFGKKEDREIEFLPFILNINGYGELEDILKIIKTEESIFADCLSSWRECLKENEKVITDKVFNKFWVNNYIMYDTCTSGKHRGNKSKYCIFEYAIKEKKIWNFDHEILDDLKEFLKIIGANNDNTTSD
jgi:hypothetical protein